MYLLSVDHRDLHVLTHSFPTRRSSDLTPLNAILGTAELLCDTTLEGGQRRSLDTIVQSGDHLLGIVNDILDFSKIEARSEEHTSELPSLMRNSYAVLCLKKKMHNTNSS